MDFTDQLSISYYKIIATLNESHRIYLVQHQESKKIYVRKELEVYSLDIYKYLYENPLPGIPQIAALYEDNNTLILIEDFIQGSTLRELIDSHSLTSEQVCTYMISLCDTLNRLHSHIPPIVHRDIKPSNIIVTSFGNVILLDFNASKYYSGEEKKESDTVLLGTHGYAAPEQYGFGESSPKTDIYSIGIMLKEIASSLDNYPSEFDSIIENCTKILPEERYTSISTLKYDLELIYKKTDNTDSVSPSAESFLPPGFRTRKPWKMIIALLTYGILFYLCSTITFKESSGSPIIQRFFTFLILFGDIFAIFNYRDVQKFCPLCKSKNILAKILGYILMLFTITFGLVAIMVMILNISTPK
ncbi:MAG: serine/threonine protein kinase [Lachnospiraceae bacterium]|nr:serine/threonine protein kinase [Lachnospiraceae bacterium]